MFLERLSLFSNWVRRSRLCLGVGMAIWLGVLGYGVWYLMAYAGTPGGGTANVEHWPAGSALTLAADRPTMVLFLHPKCPCSRATLAELERFLLGHHEACQVYLVFVRPSEKIAEWSEGVEGALWKVAGRLRDVERVDDAGGAEGGLFGVDTSGECLLFDPTGGVLFHGGITVARGHEGDNRGIQAVKDHIAHYAKPQNSAAETAETPVFGCSLGGLCTSPAMRHKEEKL